MMMLLGAFAATIQSNALEPARNPCSAGSFAIDLGFDPRVGSVEIMTPIADTDGKQPYRVTAEPVICISPRTLAEWSERAGHFEYGMTWEVTYDPAGSPTRMRSQYDYSVMMCDELAGAPHAPPDLMLGHFEWSPETGITALRVKWERDFRGYQERTCI